MSTIKPTNKLREEFEAIAQELSKRIKTQSKPIKADFPRGWIRTLSEVRMRWPYLHSNRQRTLACVVQLCDVNRLNLNIWKIGLTAGCLVEWHSTIPVIALIEALLVEYGQQERIFKNRKIKFDSAINIFYKEGIINKTLCKELHWLRNYRNEIHFTKKGKVEMYDGMPKNHNRAVIALRKVEKAIKEYWENIEVPF
jgi:hypothetical protein